VLGQLFSCEEAVIFWVDEMMGCLWRYHNAKEREENARMKKALPFGPRDQIPVNQPSLATEGLKKVDMSGAQEQFVINVQNAPKHPKFDPNVDGKTTISTMLVPIARTSTDGKIICVLAFRNKLPRRVKDAKAVAGNKSTFRADDITFLQHVASKASVLFEQAIDLQEAKETDEYLEQSKYEVRALTNISDMLASGSSVDELFPLICSEATKLLNCDRASLFLEKKTEEGSVTDKKELYSIIATGIPPINVPLKDNSIAGATVVHKEIINIPNAYVDQRFDPTWDKRTGYKTRSILCVPVIDHGTDECLGCLQLINKKDKFDRMEGAVFKGKDQDLAGDFCSVIAIAIKNANAAVAATASVGLATNVAKDGKRHSTVRKDNALNG